MKNDHPESKEYKGYTINVEYDTDPECPIIEGNHIFSNRGYVGCEKMPEEFLDEEGNFLREEFGKKYAYKNIYAYEHSGIALRTSPFSDLWDSSCFGFVAVEKSQLGADADIDALLDGIVSEYSAFCNGEVYGYIIYNKYDEEIDSGWGYFGWDSMQEMIKECESIVDKDIEDTPDTEKVLSDKSTEDLKQMVYQYINADTVLPELLDLIPENDLRKWMVETVKDSVSDNDLHNDGWI